MNDADTQIIESIWRESVRIEPQLTALERIAAGNHTDGLAPVERWLKPFIRLMDSNPKLAEYRKPIFAHLLHVHNATEAEQ